MTPHLIGLVAAALTAAPAVLLFAMLLAGIRPGEATLTRLARRGRRRTRRSHRAPRRPRLVFLGQLDPLAAAAAGRAPPR